MRKLRLLQEICTHHHGLRYLRNAALFALNGLGDQAQALGWPPVEVYGVHRVAPWQRPGSLGCAFFDGDIEKIEEGRVMIMTHDGRRQTFLRHRQQPREERVLVWQAGKAMR